MADETLRYDIIINAKASIQTLREMSDAMENNSQRVAAFSNVLIKQSKAWNVPLQQLLNTYKQLNAELSKNKEKTIFGNVGGQNIFNMSQSYLSAASAAGRFQTNQNGVVTSTKAASTQMENLAKSTKTAWGQFEIFGRKIDLVRTAFGTLEAIGIFTIISSITMALRQAVISAREFEDAIYRLRNAERVLSEQGQEITMKGIEDGIIRIKKLLPIFSKEDITGLVGQLGIALSDLNMTEKQLLDLTRAVAILNVNSVQNETLMQTGQRITSSMLTNNAKGVADLGIRFGDLALKAKAVEMGFLKDSEAVSDLTQHEKDLVKLQIVLDTAAGSSDALAESLDNNTNRLRANSAAWQDLVTVIGQVILPFLPAITGLLKLLTDGFSFLKVVLTETLTTFTVFLGVFTIWASGGINSVGDIIDAVKMLRSEMHKTFAEKFFPEGITEDTPEWFKKLFGGDLTFPDTPTGPLLPGLGEDIANLDELKKKLDDIIEETSQAKEDLAKKLSEKLADLDTEYERKALDANKDYLRKVEDINVQYERDLAALKNKQREQDKKDEEKYQLALWELRMRYLMDLEDALHARDARQVLRLMNQYKLDKEVMEKKHALDVSQREEDQRAELEDAKRKRDQRLADAKLEYQQKLADQQVAKQRELEDLNVWYAREQADIETAQQRKLETLLKGWIDEQKITRENAQAVYGILRSYFGPGGMTDALYKYMMQSLVASTQAAVQAAQSINKYGGVGTTPYGPPTMQQYYAPLAGMGGLSNPFAGRFAKGGQFVATRPTSAIFGESGKELVTVTPLSQISGMQGRNSIGANGMDGRNGTTRIVLDMSLSPDLEARVVERSMDSVASVLTNINRSKL